MQRWLRSGGRDWLWLIAAAILFLAVLLFPLATALALTPEESALAEACERGEIIRLHVVAHSDAPYDQAVKRYVRDALIDAFGDLLQTAGAQSSEAAYQALQDHLDDMLHTANASAKEAGFEGSVDAEAGVLWLPEKQYGSVTLPEGAYKALRITLGDGKGENWWCVLFPQLCLALSGDAIPPDSAIRFDSLRILRLWPVHGLKNML